MSDLVIRPLVLDDLDDALRLSTIVGWNQRLDDWRMLLRLAPAGAFAALIDARIVGTSIGIDYGGFAWIAMMIVDPAYRGRGLGGQLLEVAMGAVPSNLPIRLDATALGRPLYLRYGFEDEATLSRQVAQPPSLPATSVPAGGTGVAEGDGGCRPLTASDLETVIEQDGEAFGGMRGALLHWQLHDAAEYAYIARSGDGVTHYCLGRRGRLFDQIGPVVASDDSIAQTLVSAALEAADDRPVVIDAFDARTAFAAWLRSRGFVVQRPLVRMCRSIELGAGRTLAMRRESLGRAKEFAIVGPEFA